MQTPAVKYNLSVFDHLSYIHATFPTQITFSIYFITPADKYLILRHDALDPKI